jgi:hypothetical protein
MSVKCEFCTVNCGNKWCDFNVNYEIGLINKASALKHRKEINMTESENESKDLENLRYFEAKNIYLDLEKVDVIACDHGNSVVYEHGNSVVYDYQILLSNGFMLNYTGAGLLTQYKKYMKSKEL